MSEKRITSIKFVTKADVELGTVTSGKLVLAAGRGMQLTPDEDSIDFSVNGNQGQADPYYLAKYQAVLTGGSTDDYDFSGYATNAPYIGKVNNTAPAEEGVLFLLGTGCGQLGLFNTNGSISDSLKSNVANHSLSYTDMCQPCIDCAELEKACSYLNVIKAFYDDVKDNNLISGTKLFRQYQALVQYWNFAVQSQSLVFDASMINTNTMKLEIGYRCSACGPLSGVFISVRIEVAGQNYVYIAGGVNTRISNPENLSVQLNAWYDDTSWSGDPTYKPFFRTVEDGYVLDIKPAAMTIGDYIVYDYTLTFVHDRPSPMPPAGIKDPVETATNTWEVTATWKNTQFGSSVTKTKACTSEAMALVP